MPELKWYVVRAVSGQEKKAKHYLETEIARQALEDFIPQILIPSEKVYEMRNGKKRVRERNFFPGYILIEADLETSGEIEHTIIATPGVIGFLGSDEGKDRNRKPVPLRLSEVNRILGRMDESEDEEAALAVPFVIGERVKVMDGPFKTFTGSVREVFDDRKKVNVVVSIFGRETPVELSYQQVEKDTETDATRR